MTILDALKANHDDVKGLLKTILANKDGKKRGELFEQFKAKLTAHSRAEEKVFYRPLEKTEEGKTEALEGAVEHDVVDRLLTDLAAARQPEAEKWTARCSVLQELLEHHIEEEERDFFKTARKIFDEIDSDAIALVLALAGLTPSPVQAAGCLKGAAIGGVAGHLAGHHGLLGAGAGCIIGRHEANKHARERAEQDRASGNNSAVYTDPAATSRQR